MRLSAPHCRVAARAGCADAAGGRPARSGTVAMACICAAGLAVLLLPLLCSRCVAAHSLQLVSLQEGVQAPLWRTWVPWLQGHGSYHKTAKTQR